ncbi:MAG: helix-turn-helix domain-containing protein [Limnobaculum xujianqingii]
MALSRRQFLKSAAIVSLVIPLIPGANAALIYNSPELPPDDLPMNDWIWIGADNQIVIGVSQCEVGQGIYTGLATVLASEMDADWDKVKVKFVIGRDAYRQESGGEERSQFVAASTSMTNFYQRMRIAGAQARCFFIAAAAREWNVDAQQLRTENSFVIDDHRGKKIAYSDLIHWSQDIPLEANPVLKTAEQEKGSLIGRNLPRIDCGEKVDGSAEFGIDVQVPNLHIGVPWMGPSLNGKLGSIRNEKQILSLPGVIALVRTRHWSTLNMARLDPDMAPNTIIVVAKTYWQANIAIQQAFFSIHHKEGRLARDQSLDHLISLLSRHISTRPQSLLDNASGQMNQLRDYLHDHLSLDIGLGELSHQLGIDRFRLTRQFKKAFGQSPHAYLVQLRLRTARTLLAQGIEPALVASQVGFSDQSHMGRWFKRAYRLSPAAYQRQCTHVLD